MHPILFRIPLPDWNFPWVGKVAAIPIYSYGVMLGLSLVVGWYLTLGLAERDGLPRETMANNYVITAVAALLCSRLLYILTNLDEFHSIGDVVSVRRGGLVAYGGFLGGFIGSWSYLKTKRLRLVPWADVAVPSLASGLMITRIGCYLYGCDFGRRLSADAPSWLKSLGTFPHWPDGTLPGDGTGSPAWSHHLNQKWITIDAANSLPVHPTQLYESLVGLGLLALLLLMRRRQIFRGQIFFVATFVYGFFRFLLEIIRADPERGYMTPAVAAHILLPLCMVAFGVGYAVSFSRLVKNDLWRRITQGMAFVPGIVFYFVYRPGQFVEPVPMQLSTSQTIALLTGIAVAVGYSIYDKAALAHPEAAMSLGFDVEGDEKAGDDDAVAEAEAEKPSRETSEVKRLGKIRKAGAKKKRKGGKAKKKRASEGLAAQRSATDDAASADDTTSDASTSKEEKVEAEEKPEVEDEEEDMPSASDDEDDDEKDTEGDRRSVG